MSQGAPSIFSTSRASINVIMQSLQDRRKANGYYTGLAPVPSRQRAENRPESQGVRTTPLDDPGHNGRILSSLKRYALPADVPRPPTGKSMLFQVAACSHEK